MAVLFMAIAAFWVFMELVILMVLMGIAAVVLELMDNQAVVSVFLEFQVPILVLMVKEVHMVFSVGELLMAFTVLELMVFMGIAAVVLELMELQVMGMAFMAQAAHMEFMGMAHLLACMGIVLMVEVYMGQVQVVMV